MSEKYKSGFERLGRIWTDRDERYMNALVAVKEHFSGFTKKAGYDVSRPDKLTESQRHQIRRYYNLLTEYTERGPVYKMKKSELKKDVKQLGKKSVNRLVQMKYGAKRSKFLYVPFDGINKPEIINYQNKPAVKLVGFDQIYTEVTLNHDLMNIDPAAAVNAALQNTAPGYRGLRIMNGVHRWGDFANEGAAAREVTRLQERYNIAGNHNWSNWLGGLAVYYSKTKSLTELVKHRIESAAEFKARIKKENAKVRRKRSGK